MFKTTFQLLLGGSQLVLQKEHGDSKTFKTNFQPSLAKEHWATYMPLLSHFLQLPRGMTPQTTYEKLQAHRKCSKIIATLVLIFVQWEFREHPLFS